MLNSCKILIFLLKTLHVNLNIKIPNFVKLKKYFITAEVLQTKISVESRILYFTCISFHLPVEFYFAYNLPYYWNCLNFLMAYMNTQYSFIKEKNMSANTHQD